MRGGLGRAWVCSQSQDMVFAGTGCKRSHGKESELQLVGNEEPFQEGVKQDTDQM